jgi:hypothetical protein
VTAGDREPVAADSLPSFDRAVWRAPCGSDDVWRGKAPDPAPAGFWSHALVVEEAASSQLELLGESSW